MSAPNRIFVEPGGLKDHNGAQVYLGLSFTSEKDLDDKLWFDPEHAATDLSYLLKVHRGEMSPTLSRLALKAMALPLFVREFQGDAADDTEQIRTIPLRNSQLLDAYMDRIGDVNIDQALLKQAIDDATVLQLASLSLGSNETDDIILLPAGPEEDHKGSPTSFSVLRRKSLGRALLYVSEVRPTIHIHAPQANQHRIQIRPTDLVSTGGTRYDLAEALIAEQSDDGIGAQDYDLIQSAQTHIQNKITAHFDRIQPQS